MRTQKAIGTGKSALLSFSMSTNHCHRTIHGMVYNAMKLFMEINPQLFDDCSHDYNEHQNNADKREQARKDKWARLQLQADRMKQGLKPVAASGTATTHDNESRLDALKLHDESGIAQTAAVSHPTLFSTFFACADHVTTVTCVTTMEAGNERIPDATRDGRKMPGQQLQCRSSTKTNHVEFCSA